MSLVAWITLGLLAGLVASRLAGDSGPSMLRDIALGIAGTVVAGGLFSAFGSSGAGVISLDAALVAGGGGVLSLVAFHAFMSGIR